MTKSGSTSWNARVTESLADIGASVLQGATSTFLAVAVLLFSSSYVFVILSKQFALTVTLGIAHGLLLLPVLLSLLGPKAFSSAEVIERDDGDDVVKATAHGSDKIGGSLLNLRQKFQYRWLIEKDAYEAFRRSDFQSLGQAL